MKLETVYNYGDEVWYMKDNKPKSGKVAELKITFTYSGYNGSWHSVAYPQREEYAFEKNNKNEWDYISANLIFPTKESLLNSF